MMSVEPLGQFKEEDLVTFGHYGYVSDEIYEVESVEMQGLLSFQIFSRKLSEPFIYQWPIQGFELAFFNKQIRSGVSLGLYQQTSETVEKHLVGLAVFENRPWNRSAHINLIYVAEAHRKMGGGCILLSTVEEYACKSGVDYVTVEVQNKNGHAISFYRSKGYRIVGVDVAKYKGAVATNNQVAIYMQKDLVKTV